MQAIHYHQDALETIAERIIADQQHLLPALNHIVVIIPDYQARHRLTRLIARKAESLGYNAILLPTIATLRDYIEKNVSIEDNIIPAEQRPLLLMGALQQHQQLFENANLWTATDALLTLFDELTLYQSKLPENLDEFIQLLEQAYGCDANDIQHLGHEARLIHTLWKAWHEQLQAHKQIDANTAYLIKLNRNIQLSHDAEVFYIFAHQEMLPAEKIWLEHKTAGLFFHPDEQDFLSSKINSTQTPHDKPADTELLDAIFLEDTEHLSHRAQYIQTRHPSSPIKDKINIFKSDNFENEARAISLQIRQWRLQNIKRVGLILEDRQLARRVRALLERANIALRDAGGWALSTTSAAALLESWFEAVEENFAYKPLLTVIKSPFFLNSSDRLTAVYHLEYDIIRREAITRDLNRYRTATQSRLQRVNKQSSETSNTIFHLLDGLEQAATPLRELLEQPSFDLQQGLDAVVHSIRQIGLYSHYHSEAAGQQILELLQHLQAIATQTSLKLGWQDFRTWLSRNLEQRNFNPVDEYSEYVDLLHLPQTALAHYEGVIIGGLSSEYFPGSNNATPFFNSQVKSELGLPHWRENKRKRLNDFRRLMQSAPNVLLTVNTGSDTQQISPWLELLSSFHLIAYHDTLIHPLLHLMLQSPGSEITSEDQQAFTHYTQPSPMVPQKSIPDALSASAHQKLIDCPYAFFAAYVLKLQAPEDVSEIMAKNDYGNRVHLCLQAFHNNVAGLPGPFEKAVTEESRTEAIQLMQHIATIIFARDLEQNFLHRGWLKRWQELIPKYIDWQISRQVEWQFGEAEVRRENPNYPYFKINGRIDRIDTSLGQAGQLSIIDYKTGSSPKQESAIAGEAVQLAHYALSFSHGVQQAIFLQLDQGKITATTNLQGEELTQVVDQTKQRLEHMGELINEGKGLTAWGDKDTCNWCQFKGLCRYQG